MPGRAASITNFVEAHEYDGPSVAATRRQNYLLSLVEDARSTVRPSRRSALETKAPLEIEEHDLLAGAVQEPCMPSSNSSS